MVSSQPHQTGKVTELGGVCCPRARALIFSQGPVPLLCSRPAVPPHHTSPCIRLVPVHVIYQSTPQCISDKNIRVMRRKTISFVLLLSFSQLPDCTAAMVNQSCSTASAAEAIVGAQKGKGVKLQHPPNMALEEDFCVVLLVLPLTHNRVRTSHFYFESPS